MRTVTAVCLALAAAALIGLGEHLGQRSTKQVPERAALSPRLLSDLLRRRTFLAAIGVAIAGSVLQIHASETASPASALAHRAPHIVRQRQTGGRSATPARVTSQAAR
jgi:hypothetical protein